jgi:hypothetical protein
MKNATRERIVKMAMTAPNVDNAQPFYFRWNDDQLLIFRDGHRDRQRGNAGYYVSMVGLGCLLECVIIAASKEGLAAGISLDFNPERIQEPWAAVSFRPTSNSPDELYPGLTQRCSDRRLYQGGSLSDSVFQQVLEDASRFEECSLSFQDRPGDRLMEYLLQCEAFLWQDKHILPEMLSWVRWNRSQVKRTRDGMPWQAMAVSYLTSRLMMLVARSRVFRKIARRSGGPLRAQQRNLVSQVQSSAALGCFAVADSRPETMLTVGRAFVRAWIRLNMTGYGVQVMASPALHALQHEAGLIPEDYPQASKHIFARGRAALTKAFGCDESQIPAWMFRTGKSPTLPDNMRTLRRPLSDMVS